MSLSDSIFGKPPTTSYVTTGGTKSPGYGFAQNFFNSLQNIASNPFPSYGGHLDPGLSPTLTDLIQRAQGYASSTPPSILQGAAGAYGRLLSPNLQNPVTRIFGGAPDMFGINPNQRVFGGGTTQSMTFPGSQTGPGTSFSPGNGFGSWGGMGGGGWQDPGFGGAPTRQLGQDLPPGFGGGMGQQGGFPPMAYGPPQMSGGGFGGGQWGGNDFQGMGGGGWDDGGAWGGQGPASFNQGLGAIPGIPGSGSSTGAGAGGAGFGGYGTPGPQTGVSSSGGGSFSPGSGNWNDTGFSFGSSPTPSMQPPAPAPRPQAPPPAPQAAHRYRPMGPTGGAAPDVPQGGHVRPDGRIIDAQGRTIYVPGAASLHSISAPTGG